MSVETAVKPEADYPLGNKTIVLKRDTTVFRLADMSTSLLLQNGRIYVMGQGWRNDFGQLVVFLHSSGDAPVIRSDYKTVFNKQNQSLPDVDNEPVIFWRNALQLNNKYFAGWSIQGIDSYTVKGTLAFPMSVYNQVLGHLNLYNSLTHSFILTGAGTEHNGNHYLTYMSS